VLAWLILYYEGLSFFCSEDSAMSRPEMTPLVKLKTASGFRQGWVKATELSLSWLR
jgi:hypothetical protein